MYEENNDDYVRDIDGRQCYRSYLKRNLRVESE